MLDVQVFHRCYSHLSFATCQGHYRSQKISLKDKQSSKLNEMATLYMSGNKTTQHMQLHKRALLMKKAKVTSETTRSFRINVFKWKKTNPMLKTMRLILLMDRSNYMECFLRSVMTMTMQLFEK